MLTMKLYPQFLIYYALMSSSSVVLDLAEQYLYFKIFFSPCLTLASKLEGTKSWGRTQDS